MKKLVKVLFVALLVFALAACGSKEKETVELKKVTVAASPVPHAEILNHVKPILAEKGYDLEVIEFEDYDQPNQVVFSGEIDCNYFQHLPYLDSWNEGHSSDLVSLAFIHYEPLGIYKGKANSVEEISDGAEVLVPSDPSNEARALLLLQANGLITLNETSDGLATVLDIKDNPLNLKITEVEAAQIPARLQEVACAVINGNYALQAGLTPENVIVYETQEAASEKANIIAVKAGNEENEGVKALIEVLKSSDVQAWINETYSGSVVAFEG